MLNRCTVVRVIVFIGSRGVDEDHVWAVLQEQGRMVKWLARVTDIPAQRLYDIRHRRSWWHDAEAEAVFKKGWRQNLKEWNTVGSDYPYHYLGSAKTMCRIGKAFGEAMLELKNPG